MSRLFDALQRSGTEQSGVEYPDLVSMATELFEGQSAPASPESPVAGQETRLDNVTREAVSEEGVGSAIHAEPEFPSLNVSVAASSRLVFFTEPDSLAAEKFRFLGVRLRQLQQSRPIKTILVTSTIPEEGKSLVAANLAGVLARRKKALLIDGDLRRPVLAKQFGLGRLSGLGEWLLSERKTIGNIYRLDDLNFWIMPAGSPPANPLELMQSGRLSKLMEQVSSMFDWIIVDSPPLLPLADTTVWSRLTDGTLLVARVGKTEKAPLQRGLDLIKKPDLLGVVLNGCTSTEYKDYYKYSSHEAE